MSLRDVFERQPQRRYIMFGGKGGLGKTTLSATCAYWLARQGKRVLLFSVDPQASLSDIFQKDIFGKGAVPIIENLWAQEIDADKRIQEYQDEILEELQYIKNRINTSSQILTDKQKTAFFFVLAPEEMIILDTRKAAELFARFDVPISGYVVNRVLPQELRRDNIPTYLKNRIQLQEKYLGEIRNSLGGQILSYVPEMERDITGLSMIERLAGQLFENSR